MRFVQLLFAVLAGAQCAHSFVVRTPIVAAPSPAARQAVGPTMCVPKEAAVVILAVGAGFLLTQGVPPAKADMLSMGDSPATGASLAHDCSFNLYINLVTEQKVYSSRQLVRARVSLNSRSCNWHVVVPCLGVMVRSMREEGCWIGRMDSRSNNERSPKHSGGGFVLCPDHFYACLE